LESAALFNPDRCYYGIRTKPTLPRRIAAICDESTTVVREGNISSIRLSAAGTISGNPLEIKIDEPVRFVTTPRNVGRTPVYGATICLRRKMIELGCGPPFSPIAVMEDYQPRIHLEQLAASFNKPRFRGKTDSHHADLEPLVSSRSSYWRSPTTEDSNTQPAITSCPKNEFIFPVQSD